MAMVTVPRLILLVIVLWALLFLLYTSPFNRSSNDDNGNSSPIDNQEMILARLSRASSELKWLKKQNEELRTLLDHLIPLKGSPMGHNPLPNENVAQESTCTPTTEFESTRRRLTYDLNELWFYLRTKVNNSMIGFINEHRHNMLQNLGK